MCSCRPHKLSEQTSHRSTHQWATNVNVVSFPSLLKHPFISMWGPPNEWTETIIGASAHIKMEPTLLTFWIKPMHLTCIAAGMLHLAHGCRGTKSRMKTYKKLRKQSRKEKWLNLVEQMVVRRSGDKKNALWRGFRSQNLVRGVRTQVEKI